MVFGLTSSPFLLSSVIRYHLNRNPGNFEANVVQKLLKSFYAEKCVTSVDSTFGLKEFISKATIVMAATKTDLRLWQFGYVE